ncbi:uncharacterized protein LOC114532327 isoform X2 [Dendronephthya gigantea]|uniref:uncharacterized protein LOC114532327 isoform X2 n=1 Tax=Dendronephthya gigantea TaxID=151771 RepID=UPI00106D08D0|nr:uncharacterized protein LOC114532327 isoform X2 [Dendronephthya gigantea]
MALEVFHIKIHICFVPIVCLAVLLCSWQSNANSNGTCGKLTRCPDWLRRKRLCYCPNGDRVKFTCVNGKWKNLPCAPRCPKLKEILYGAIKYSNDSSRLPGTSAKYKCIGYSHKVMDPLDCDSNGKWNRKEPESNMCYCEALDFESDNLEISYNPPNSKSRYYVLKTVVTYFCKGSNKEIQLASSTCKNTGEGKGAIWTPRLKQSSIEKCRSQRPTIRVQVSKTTKPPIHHTDERTVIIVSGTTGAILGALIILVVIVSCQRRIHYHRMRRARIRHRQDQDAFTAFITYHRDARLLLPSYDEAINQEEQGQPPSFEEALGHYEEPTLPPGHTSAEDGCPSDTQDASSAPPGSETHSLPETSTSFENHSDASPLLDSQTSPASENSRLFRSLRALFGGRTFRPDAIYCRFVPDDTGESESQTSTRAVETEPPDSSAELAEVLTRAGLC